MTAIYIQTIAGRPPFEAAVPIGNEFEQHFFMPFLNVGGLTMAVSLVNATNVTAPLTIIARNGAGQELCRQSGALAPGQHDARILSAIIPCTAGRAGGLEFQVGGLGIASIGLLFQDSGAFTTVFPMVQYGK